MLKRYFQLWHLVISWNCTVLGNIFPPDINIWTCNYNCFSASTLVYSSFKGTNSHCEIKTVNKIYFLIKRTIDLCRRVSIILSLYRCSWLDSSPHLTKVMSDFFSFCFWLSFLLLQMLLKVKLRKTTLIWGHKSISFVCPSNPVSMCRNVVH